eukprot:m.48318 g.48318  ORF g.48318 m.48318 type:complete len:775 (-) comp10823_c0_seq1:157-2481(-)
MSGEEGVKCHYIGIDMGSDTLVLGRLIDTGAVDLLVTKTGSRSIKPAVSFQGKQRLIGQEAHDSLMSNVDSTIVDVIQTLEPRAELETTAVESAADESGSMIYKVHYTLSDEEGDLFSVSSRDVLVMLLVKIVDMFVGSDGKYIINLAVADAYGDNAIKVVNDACQIVTALAPHANVVFYTCKGSACMVRRYNQQHGPQNDDDGEEEEVEETEVEVGDDKKEKEETKVEEDEKSDDGDATCTDGNDVNEGDEKDQGQQPKEQVTQSLSKIVVLVDVGKAFTTVSVCALKGNGALSAIKTTSSHFGCHDLDNVLYGMVVDKLAAKGFDVSSIKQGSRRFLRVMKECEGSRKILSANRQTNIVLEVFGDNEESFSFEVTRSEFEKRSEGLMASFRDILTQAIGDSSPADCAVEFVELVGGGTCIPMIQAVVRDVVGVSEEKLRVTLDRSSCVAIGATLLVGEVEKKTTKATANDSVVARVTESLTKDEITSVCEIFNRMNKQDEQLKMIRDARNQLEGFIFSSKTLSSQKHGTLINDEETNKVLDEALEWLDSHDTDAASFDEYNGRFETLKGEIESINKVYFDTVREEEEKLAEERKKEEEEWAKQRESEVKEDHDNRKLPTAKRMQQVLRNKAEATELFKDGNYAHATARYARALGLTSKFFDLNPDEKKEVDDITTVLHLNLAMCYLKQKQWKKAVSECDEALAGDDTNPKAYYRKAYALECMKDIDEAFKVGKQGAKLAPEDTALSKLVKRLEGKKKKQLAKEKKMYSKMFG